MTLREKIDREIIGTTELRIFSGRDPTSSVMMSP